MAEYKVRSGQNIYDIALTLYGSIEGLFSLLVSNPWLTLDTKLTYGMILEYPDVKKINEDVSIWLKEKNILVKNGDNAYSFLDIEKFIETHFDQTHPDISNELEAMSPDEQSMFWESLYTPKMIINHHEQLATIKLKLLSGTHLIIDWGDYSEPTIVEGEKEQEIEHCYKSNGEHIITFYGDFICDLLDFTNLNGIYYPLSTIQVNKFITPIQINELNKLIIPQ